MWQFNLKFQYLVLALYCIIDAAVRRLLAEVGCYVIMLIARMGCSSQRTTIQRHSLKKYLKLQAADHLALGSSNGKENFFFEHLGRGVCKSPTYFIGKAGCLHPEFFEQGVLCPITLDKFIRKSNAVNFGQLLGGQIVHKHLEAC